VKRGIENGYLRDVGPEDFSRSANSFKVVLVMQRGEGSKTFDIAFDLFIHEHSAAVFRSAMNNPMTDRVYFRRPAQDAAFVPQSSQQPLASFRRRRVRWNVVAGFAVIAQLDFNYEFSRWLTGRGCISRCLPQRRRRLKRKRAFDLKQRYPFTPAPGVEDKNFHCASGTGFHPDHRQLLISSGSRPVACISFTNLRRRYW